MFDIVNDDDFNKFKSIIKDLEKYSNPEELKDAQILGKSQNVLVDFDTGLGVTIQDLYKEDKELYEMYMNFKRIESKIVDDLLRMFNNV